MAKLIDFEWPEKGSGHTGIEKVEGPEYEWDGKADHQPTRSLEYRRERAKAKEENLPETVMGKQVGSKNEARVAVALGIMQLPFRYQVSVFGGRHFPGGQIIDFLVLTRPRPTPLYVQSKYWHGPSRRKEGADFLQQAQVRARRRGWMDPREIWDYETKTVEQALLTLTKMFGRH